MGQIKMSVSAANSIPLGHGEKRLVWAGNLITYSLSNCPVACQ